MQNNRIKEKSRNYFNELAQAENGYDIPEPKKCYPYIIDVIEKIGDRKSKILDIGCGEGDVLLQLSEMGYTSLYGVDLSDEAVKRAKEMNPKINFAVGDVEQLPFDDEEFEVIVCSHSFHHYPNPMVAMKEIHRILQRGGRLLLVENSTSFIRRFFINVSLVIRHHPNGDIRWYSRRNLSGIAKRAGFSEMKSMPITKLSYMLKAVR